MLNIKRGPLLPVKPGDGGSLELCHELPRDKPPQRAVIFAGGTANLGTGLTLIKLPTTEILMQMLLQELKSAGFSEPATFLSSNPGFQNCSPHSKNNSPVGRGKPRHRTKLVIQLRKR